MRQVVYLQELNRDARSTEHKLIHKRLTNVHCASSMTHILAVCGGKDQKSLLIHMVHIVTIRS